MTPVVLLMDPTLSPKMGSAAQFTPFPDPAGIREQLSGDSCDTGHGTNLSHKNDNMYSTL